MKSPSRITQEHHTVGATCYRIPTHQEVYHRGDTNSTYFKTIFNLRFSILKIKYLRLFISLYNIILTFTLILSIIGLEVIFIRLIILTNNLGVIIIYS